MSLCAKEKFCLFFTCSWWYLMAGQNPDWCWFVSSVFFSYFQRKLSIQMALCSPTRHPPTHSAFLATLWSPAWPTPCHPASTSIMTCWPVANAKSPSRWATSFSSLSTRRSNAKHHCCPTVAMTSWTTEEEEGVCKVFITMPSRESWGRWWSRWRSASRWRRRRRRRWEGEDEEKERRGGGRRPPKEFAQSRKTHQQVGSVDAHPNFQDAQIFFKTCMQKKSEQKTAFKTKFVHLTAEITLVWKCIFAWLRNFLFLIKSNSF